MDSIPLVHSLAEIYTAKAIPQQEKRFQKLIAAFESIYSATDGAESSVAAIKIARAPGRVVSFINSMLRRDEQTNERDPDGSVDYDSKLQINTQSIMIF